MKALTTSGQLVIDFLFEEEHFFPGELLQDTHNTLTP
jgi:hypothetical protein